MDPASSSQKISPALPVLTISSPTANTTYTGGITAQVAIKGTGIAVVSFFLDGKQLPSLAEAALPGQQVSYPLNTDSMADGTHTLTVVAAQSDLLTSTASVSFATANQLATVNSNLASANSTINTLNGNLDTANGNIASLQGNVASLQSNLDSANHTISNLTYLAYFAIIVGAVGIVVAAYSLRGSAPRKQSAEPTSPL